MPFRMDSLALVVGFRRRPCSSQYLQLFAHVVSTYHTPPAEERLSKTVTSTPSFFKYAPVAAPLKPAPMTATRDALIKVILLRQV